MILIAGGSSKLGRHLAPRLASRGVRVLTRDPKRADMAGVEIVTGDLRAPADVAAAVRGCTVVVSAVHGFAGQGRPSPEAIDRDGNCTLIQAAREAGVGHFVLISVQGAAADHPMSLHRAKYAAEEALRASGLAYTIVRPTAFMETWTEIIGGPLAEKGYALLLGPGRNPINFVSVRDVAALTALVVEQDPRNEAIEIGGPEDLDFVTVAERLCEARGVPTHIKHIPLPVLRAMSLLARPFSPVFARQAKAAVVMNTRDFSFRDGAHDRFPSLPRTTLSDLLRAQ